MFLYIFRLQVALFPRFCDNCIACSMGSLKVLTGVNPFGVELPSSPPLDSYLLAESVYFLPPSFLPLKLSANMSGSNMTVFCFSHSHAFHVFIFFPLAPHALKDIYCWQQFFFWWSVNFVISPSVNHRLCRSRPVDTESHPILSHYSVLHPTPLQPTSPHTRSPIKAIFLKLFKGSSKSSEVAVLLRSDIFAFAFKVLWARCIVR